MKNVIKRTEQVRVGVSRTQLREVINGNRKSKRLMARLRDAGIKVVA